jgi:hypothetical protein
MQADALPSENKAGASAYICMAIARKQRLAVWGRVAPPPSTPPTAPFRHGRPLQSVCRRRALLVQAKAISSTSLSPDVERDTNPGSTPRPCRRVQPCFLRLCRLRRQINHSRRRGTKPAAIMPWSTRMLTVATGGKQGKLQRRMFGKKSRIVGTRAINKFCSSST